MSTFDSPTDIHALPRRVPKAEFVAGRLSLAFCNTVALPDAADRCADAESFAAWAARGGHALPAPPDAASLERFLALRETLIAIFAQLVIGFDPPAAALEALAAAALPPQLVWDSAAHRAVARPGAHDPLTAFRQAIVADAIDLLTGEAQFRIKRCPAADCRWFFFDTTKNGRRRWCAMGDCGVKDKVGRFRIRHQAAF
ncbi:CGNR zinc finger domain-containing protein [Dongia sp.]|uniref:CGNR zinc finger domain-containing protein n=1 Tax=Dongia sp. TaxID=1977262 RepID=UPI0035B18D92